MLSKYFTTTWTRTKPTPAIVAAAIDKYFVKLPPRLNDINYSLAKEEVSRAFRLPEPIRPMHIEDVISQYKNGDRSPGLPHTKLKFQRKDQVDPQLLVKASRSIKWGQIRKWNVPCNAVPKTLVSPKDKVRLIWVYPTEMTFIEGMFAMPLINAYNTHTLQDNPYGIWVRYGKGDMKVISRKRRATELWLSCDWSAFDTSVPAWLIRDAFKILAENIDWSGRYHEQGMTKPEYLQRLWNSILQYFIDTPVKYPDGSIRVKHSGVPSGSFFTNILDTIINAIVVHYLMKSEQVTMGYKLFMGDDSLIAVTGHVDLNRMASTAKRLFGFTLNPDKSDFGLNPSFLGFTFSERGHPIVDYDKCVAQLLLPSYPDKKPEDPVIRAKAIRLSALGGSQRFHDEVTYWLSLQVETRKPLHHKSEIFQKMEMLGLDINDDVTLMLNTVR